MPQQSPRGRFPNYWCHIYQPSNNVDVLADLPEEFSYTAMSHYMGPTGTVGGGIGEALGSIPIAGGLMQTGANAAVGLFGGDYGVKSFTKRVWSGTEPIQFSLRLLFDAEHNSYDDVHETLNLLAAIALPSDQLNGYAISAPNSYRAGGYNKLSIRIGRQYYFEECIILSAAPAINIMLDADGYPIAGAIDIQCCTETVYSKDDLYKAAGIRNFKRGPVSVTRSGMADAPGLSPVRLMRLNNGEED